MADQSYGYVVTGERRAMVIQQRIGGGWMKVADTRSEHKARELAEGLNALQQSDNTLSDIARLVREMGVGTQDPIAALLIARGLLREEDLNAPDA